MKRKATSAKKNTKNSSPAGQQTLKAVLEAEGKLYQLERIINRIKEHLK